MNRNRGFYWNAALILVYWAAALLALLRAPDIGIFLVVLCVVHVILFVFNQTVYDQIEKLKKETDSRIEKMKQEKEVQLEATAKSVSLRMQAEEANVTLRHSLTGEKERFSGLKAEYDSLQEDFKKMHDQDSNTINRLLDEKLELKEEIERQKTNPWPEDPELKQKYDELKQKYQSEKEKRKKLEEKIKENSEIPHPEDHILSILESAFRTYYPEQDLPKEFHEAQFSVDHYFNLADELRGAAKNQYIGTRYERYVASIYHERGYEVIFNGALKGKQDNGVDLIASKGRDVLLIQCKCYSAKIPMTEDVLLRLAGAIRLYAAEMGRGKNYQGILYTHKDKGKLSPRFKSLAGKLNIPIVTSCKEKIPFPIIKYCKSGKFKGKYILPADPEYDAVALDADTLLFRSMNEMECVLSQNDDRTLHLYFENGVSIWI